MSKETISSIWGFDDPIDEKKSEPLTNSCPYILCVMGKCTESSMQIKLKFDEPATECKLEILKY